ncbi:ATP-binding protein [Sinomonas cyclohexanicum]|uniref:ATP-binding protein n=1 Tax=Sinomonas cyclohexanicum TaxID=322009 RepID=A0ABN6FAY3_SINCY|nr:hypothetical protein [Corynebacterium cyclohexanicum]BCT74204.1 ATP-binding protein [Corynebacterium cyclohexanicum]
MAQQLVELALECFDFGVDTNDKPFAVAKGGHVTRSLRGDKRSVRKELGGLYYRMTGKTASQNALAEAMDVLECLATATEPVKLSLRVARPNDDEVYVDLGNQAEQVVRITPDRWEVLDGDADVPVLFRRTSLTLPLPTPEPGGDLDQLWTFVNAPRDHDRQVIRGWLVGAVVLVGLPCPILALLGEQGTAKSSALRRTFQLFDPSKAEVRMPPKDATKLMHSLNSSRANGFDNLSSIPKWQSDIFCQAVTGGSDVDRALYTDDEQRIIEFQCVVGFTGIDVGALAGDFAERCVWAELSVIPSTERRSERELNALWNEAYPSMVGGLFDLVAQTLRMLPKVNLAEKPRMADFAEVPAAIDLAIGTNGLEHYMLSHELVSEEIVATDKFLAAISGQVTRRWEGTGKALYDLLPRPVDDRFWPEQRGVSGKLKKVAPDLRKAGWVVEQVVPDPKSKRPKTWVLVPPGTARVTASDVAALKAARQLHDLDMQRWVERLLADGMAPDIAAERASVLRGSPMFNGHPDLQAMAVTSQAIDQRLFDDLGRLGLTLAELDQLGEAGDTTAEVQ